MERQNRLDVISKKYEDLWKEISAYNSDYGISHNQYLPRFYELVEILNQ